MFPKSKNEPAPTAIEPRNLQIATTIPVDLRGPKCSVRLWAAAMEAATMPEARIDKDDKLFRTNCNVRRSVHPNVLAVSDSGLPEATTESTFNLAVALFDSRHDPATNFASYRIHN